MADDITSHDYWAEVKDTARRVFAEATEEDREISDVLFEAIDGHQYVIYTYANLAVLTHSSNDGAYFDNFGELKADGFSDAVQKMAYAAFEADVQEALESAESDASWTYKVEVSDIEWKGGGGPKSEKVSVCDARFDCESDVELHVQQLLEKQYGAEIESMDCEFIIKITYKD